MVVLIKCWSAPSPWFVYVWNCGGNPPNKSSGNKIPGKTKKNRQNMFASLWSEHNEWSPPGYAGAAAARKSFLGLVLLWVWSYFEFSLFLSFVFLIANSKNKRGLFVFLGFSSESTARCQTYPKMFKARPTISHTPICGKWTQRNKPRLFFSVHGEKFLCHNSKISFASRLFVAVATRAVNTAKKLYSKEKNMCYRSIQIYVMDDLLM